VECDLVIAVGRDLSEVAIPGFARLDPELVAPPAGECVPGAFNVGRGEWLAVAPFDILTQAEGQRGPDFVPRPVAGEVGNDRGEAFLRHVLVEQNEVVEHPISGIPAAIVDSSWIDMLAGLAKPGICRMPPGFCANAAVATSRAASSGLAARHDRGLPIIRIISMGSSRR
jgi:hypothetical protein